MALLAFYVNYAAASAVAVRCCWIRLPAYIHTYIHMLFVSRAVCGFCVSAHFPQHFNATCDFIIIQYYLLFSYVIQLSTYIRMYACMCVFVFIQINWHFLHAAAVFCLFIATLFCFHHFLSRLCSLLLPFLSFATRFGCCLWSSRFFCFIFAASVDTSCFRVQVECPFVLQA